MLQERQREELQQKIQNLQGDCHARIPYGLPGRHVEDAENNGVGGSAVGPKRMRKPRKEWSPPRVEPEQVAEALEVEAARGASKEEQLTPEQR